MTDKERTAILERDGYVCAYCLGIAEEVDHILPWSWNKNDDADNLAASCRDCNRIASNKVFETAQEKFEYINAVRKNPKWQKKTKNRISVCVHCKRTYKPRHQGSTVFLCSECVNLSWKE